ncbi:SDR family NAD(P)-dependent oxidoreductase [Micromonospora radicis]|uniref:SDR family NAD(P)-dependent oxidoreductase n=1 Tax=Micromonospora radicis TaxID=1894971 RepID=A0A418MWL9_9ACTN|nr:SDR family NAD(P)-dependent oxidoreductase [Micromonospora radicis]RIV39012.1 SDR family NAD(P)-dependent oxidoreductase [Micromonospora radicis]
MPPVPSANGRWALITGATAGIGAAFAARFAADGWHLVLVARDATRLAAQAAELTGRYGIETETIAADLSTDDGCTQVERRLAASPAVETLVNNAGISLNKPFLRSSVEDEARLLRLNVHAVMRLSLAALQVMTERRGGAVINVSSVAGFGAVMPGSTYSASKAWVTNFSESVGQSARPFGVRVMALCPGYTRTEFHQRAGIDMSKTPEWLWLNAPAVVDEALRDLRKGKLVSVPSWKYKLAVAGLRHAPRRLLDVIARDTRGRIGRDRG